MAEATNYTAILESQRRPAAPVPPPVETGGKPPSPTEVVSTLAPGERSMPQAPIAPPITTNTMPPTVSTDPWTLDSSAGVPTAQPSWYDNPVMAARAILDGMTFGLSNITGAGVAAGLAYLTTPSPMDMDALITENRVEPIRGGWNQYKAIYRDMMRQLQDEREIYTANNPKASLILNVAGGFLSPINKPIAWVGGKILAAGKSMIGTGGDKLATLLRRPELTQVQRRLGQMEQRNATGQLIPDLAAAPARPGMLNRAVTSTVQAAPGGAIGGGLYGATMAPQDAPMGEAALEGAKMGVAFSPVAAALPAVFRTLTRRRVAQELSEGKDFKPLTVAAGRDNPILNWMYNSLIGKAFVSSSMLENQAARWYTPLARRVDDYQKQLTVAKNLLGGLANRVAASVKAEAKNMEQTIRQTGAATVRTIRANYQQRIDAIRQNAAVAEQATTMVPQNFRAQAMHRALPESFPAEVRQAVFNAMEMGEYRRANLLLREAWNEHGFSMLNNNTFKIGTPSTQRVEGDLPLWGGKRPVRNVTTVDITPIVDRVESALTADDLAALTIPGNKLEFIRQEVTRFLNELVDNKGNMRGSSLATLRNMISGQIGRARMTGTQDPIAAEMRTVWMELKNTLDDVIQEQLSPLERAAFQEQTAAYRTRLAIDEAITKTSAGYGAFEPQDWLRAIRSRFTRDYGVDRAPLQREAETARDAIVSAEAAIVGAGEQMRLITAQQLLVENNNMKAAVEAAIAQTKAEVARVTARIPNEIQRRMSQAERTGAVQGTARLQALEDQIKQLDAQREQLLRYLPSRGNLTATQSWVPTLLIGGFNLLGGAATAPVLATQTAQRTLAGQTAIQQSLDRIMRQVPMGQVITTMAGGETAIDRADVAAMKNAPPERKRMIYNALKSSGRLEEFRTKQPMLYNELLKAAP